MDGPYERQNLAVWFAGYREGLDTPPSAFLQPRYAVMSRWRRWGWLPVDPNPMPRISLWSRRRG